jgi:hypothetical protein
MYSETRLFSSLAFAVYYSRDRDVVIATGYGLDDRGVGFLVTVWSRIFTSPCRPDHFWGPSSLLSSVYGVFFPGGKAAS